MSILKDQKTIIVPKPFVINTKMKLRIDVSVNDRNQIVQFKVEYNGQAGCFKVIDSNVLAAWQRVEKFIVNNKKKGEK